jgi:hypothetical protein
MLVLPLILVLTFSMLSLSISPASATDVTTSVKVTKLANDNTTVIEQVTITVAQMMANSSALPIYGDGVTHYYCQGPTFNASDMWDPNETTNVDSRDYGACMGTNVKDLCEMLPSGGADPGDIIKIKSPDGFSKTFDYTNVYTPQARQGKMIITWYTNGTAEGTGGYVTDGSYSNGMRLMFFAETTNADGKHVFGNWDMHETLAPAYWHYYYDGSTMWPSSSGLSVKWVSDVVIYSSEAPPVSPTWTLTLNGSDTYSMDQTEFETGAACHAATWVDGNNTWSGIPLWRLVGYVDDENRHGTDAFNDRLAAVGYTVRVIASDGFSRDFPIASIARNDSVIVANKYNGADLPTNQYPLRLVGPTLSSGQKVSKIVQIQLVGLPRGEANGTLTAIANVAIGMVGIELNRSSVDYGDVMPGENSTVQAVGVTNIGTLKCNVTVEVKGANGIAQSFYEQSLHIDGTLYNINAIIASIQVSQTQNVNTQLKVPSSWSEPGSQQAVFIFWATAA